MSPTFKIMLTAASAASLAGCAIGPGQGPQPKPAEAYVSTTSFQAPATAWPQDRWWTGYNDPQLTRLIDEGLKDSPNVAAAAARLDRANAQVSLSRAGLGPTVTANGSASKLKQSKNLGIPPQFVPEGYQPTARATLDFRYEVDLWGRNRSLFAAASSEARAAQADAAQARLMLSTAIAEAYGDLRRLYAARALATQASDVRGQSADLVSRRVANGVENRVSYNEALARVPAAAGDEVALDEAIATARNRIAALMGAGPDRGLQITPPPAVELRAFGLPPHIGAELLGRRPDIVASRWRAEAAARRVGAARAAFLPNLDLIGFVGRQALPIDLFSKSGSGIGQGGAALSLPIFDMGSLVANARGARADYALAVAQYDGAVTEAFRQVADVVAAEQGLATRRGEAAKALSANEEALRLANLRYTGGLEPLSSVLRVQDAVLQSRRVSADLDARAFSLDIQLIRALGGPASL